MALKNQAELEAQYPDRFEGAAPWLALADAVLELPRDLTDARFLALMQSHEDTRLNAKFLSLAGIDDLRPTKNRLALEVRASRDPWSISRYAAANAILTEAEKAPDKRYTAKKWLEQFDLIPTSSEIAAYHRRVAKITKPTTGRFKASF